MLRVLIQQLNNKVKSKTILTIHKSEYTLREPRELHRFSADDSDLWILYSVPRKHCSYFIPIIFCITHAQTLQFTEVNFDITIDTTRETRKNRQRCS